MSSLGADFGVPTNPRTYMPSDEFVLPSCLIGAEFEFERVGTTLPAAQSWASLWEAKRDGSLHDNGMEYVFAQPMFGEDAVMALRNLVAHANEHGLAATLRTGLHIHVDMRDVNKTVLYKMCILYSLFEKAIYRYVGDDREENVFCLPWYTSHGIVRTIKQLLMASSPALMRAVAAGMGDRKYSGLNLDCLARFGSIEFRHHLVSKDIDRVLQWVNICLSFKKAALAEKGTPMELVTEVETSGPMAVAERVFGKYMGALYYPEFTSDVLEHGVLCALDLIDAGVEKELAAQDNFVWPEVTNTPKATTKNKKFEAWRTGSKKAEPLANDELLGADRPVRVEHLRGITLLSNPNSWRYIPRTGEPVDWYALFEGYETAVWAYRGTFYYVSGDGHTIYRHTG